MKLIPKAVATFLLGAAVLGAPGSAFADGKKVPMDQLPAPTRDAITREATGGKVDKVERVSDDGRLFKAEIKKAGQETEIYVDADGKIVGRHAD